VSETQPPSGVAAAVAPGPAAEGAARLNGLMTISQVLASTRRERDVIRLSAAAARTALGADAVSISRLDRRTRELRTLVNAGDLAPGEEPFPRDEVCRVADYRVVADLVDRGTGFVVCVDDDAADPAQVALLRRRGKSCSLAVPIVLEGRTWGELYAARSPGSPPFTPEDLPFAAAVAAQIAAGLSQAAHAERIAALAYRDPLTGLANRRALEERLDAAMERHRSDGTVVSLLMADVNGLKAVNDEHGHEAGDRLLQRCARLLAEVANLLSDGLAARIGGDEFCVLVEGRPSGEVLDVAAQACARVAAEGGGHLLSCGLASTGDPVGRVDTPARLMRLADAAQYRAKRSGATDIVVAGRPLPPEIASALPAVPEIEPGVPERRRQERRRVLSRSRPDPGRVLEAVLRALDGTAAKGPQARLEVVGAAVARLVDAAGWWVSHVPPGAADLETVAFSVLRGDGDDRHLIDQLGTRWPLHDHPVSAAAVRGGSYALEVGAPGNDPAEEALLVASGFAGVVAAGATDPSGGWLLEVFTDEISARPVVLRATVRALVSVAVHG
jgi:diguanylate cyclase (GGDEF)-like protein